MNKLDNAKRAQVVAALVEGNSIRATARMTDVARNTINKLLLDLGTVCSEYMNKNLVNLQCKRVQCDEIWAFIAAKQANVSPRLAAENPHADDVWTWIAMDADTKLVCSWMVGNRDWPTAHAFIDDLQSRLANKIQLSTDGLKLYFNAVTSAFAGEVDYAIVQKIYGGGVVDESGPQTRYSPMACVGCERKIKIGKPDPKHISTSFIERQNLTIRMQVRRYTRLTNAFSKRIENHIASLAIHYMHYNFCRIHSTLRITPAMAAGVSDHIWEMEQLLQLLG
jgi:IS1 family transposase